jgi:hypothetical protein
MTFPLDLIKFYQFVQKLLLGKTVGTDRQAGDVMSLFIFKGM